MLSELVDSNQIMNNTTSNVVNNGKQAIFITALRASKQ